MKQAIQIVQQAFQALRQGVATELQWHEVVTAMRVADAVAIARGSKGARAHIAQACQALEGIRARAMQAGAWRPVEIYFAEIDAVDVGVEIFTDQASTPPAGVGQLYARVCTLGGRSAADECAGEQLALIGD